MVFTPSNFYPTMVCSDSIAKKPASLQLDTRSYQSLAAAWGLDYFGSLKLTNIFIHVYLFTYIDALSMYVYIHICLYIYICTIIYIYIQNINIQNINIYIYIIVEICIYA